MLAKTARLLLRPFLGRRQFQPVFRLMYKLSLAGMNVGEGGAPTQSGEAWVLHFVRSRLGKTVTPVIFDVGANRGQFATDALAVFGDDARLWSFEPCQASFEKLRDTLSGRKNVTIVNAAVSSRDGVVEMFSPQPTSKLASLYQRPTVWDNASAETVASKALDSYCAENKISKIHFLKIDVEGHELEVLHGTKGMLEANAIDFIQFEFSAAHIDARVFFRDFYSLLTPKYALYRVLQNGLEPVNQYNPELELFKRATNYLAIHRDQCDSTTDQQGK
jgi:FkbM family methyltransferase